MSSALPPTREQLLALYRQHMNAARSFASYNFREYFLRRTRDKFRGALSPGDTEVSKNMQESAAALSRVPTAGPGSLKLRPQTQQEPMSAEQLAAFFQHAKEELKVLQRAAVTNMMYEGDRLVVEEDASRDWVVRSADEDAEKKLDT
ncbi:hypothetical protein MSPP1_000959 [Malassezia sp. CBS 17886]|nr:hypothetical protein MSPP1_000959 [Malassezia sp. CBS 17886]